LPDRVDPDGIKAGFKDGLLTVSVPKAESAKPRRIEVSTD
jgi:HSP20 family protein